MNSLRTALVCLSVAHCTTTTGTMPPPTTTPIARPNDVPPADNCAEGTAGTAASDSITLTGTLPTASGTAELTLAGRTETRVQVVVPPERAAHPALVIAFHGTGNEPSDAVGEMGLEDAAARYGFIVVAPRAGYREVNHPGDFDHRENEGGSSWNLWDPNANTNDDLRYVRGIIQKARTAYGIDTDRVYTVGFSNGAFFSAFAAARLSDRIAGFGEASGGATRCANIHDPAEFIVDDPSVTTCAAIRARQGFPVCSGALQPDFTGRLPFGYLSHFNDDDTVSVAWTCVLADVLGARAQTHIANNPGPEAGHLVTPSFIADAWPFLCQHTRRE